MPGELPSAPLPSADPGPGPGRCANCASPLGGPFCSACGQEARHSARSLRTLLYEVFESLTELDGRLWRTIRGLLIRPGLLTVEYLADRRVRYLPPFRLYLVISVLFFAVALSMDAKPTPVVGPAPSRSPADIERQARNQDEARRLCRLLRGGQLEKRLQLGLPGICERIVSDRGKALAEAFVQNMPRTMFVFLPVMALALQVLFGRSRRFYVEHVVFTLHLQTAMFVAFGVGVFVESWRRLDPVEELLLMGVVVYMAWYIYRALRVVYGQSRRRTAAKLVVCGCIYGVLLGVSALGTVIFSALQV